MSVLEGAALLGRRLSFTGATVPCRHGGGQTSSDMTASSWLARRAGGSGSGRGAGLARSRPRRNADDHRRRFLKGSGARRGTFRRTLNVRGCRQPTAFGDHDAALAAIQAWISDRSQPLQPGDNCRFRGNSPARSRRHRVARDSRVNCWHSDSRMIASALCSTRAGVSSRSRGRRRGFVAEDDGEISDKRRTSLFGKHAATLARGTLHEVPAGISLWKRQEWTVLFCRCRRVISYRERGVQCARRSQHSCRVQTHAPGSSRFFQEARPRDTAQLTSP